MNIKRKNRISEEIRKVVSELLMNGIKDPRVSSMTTITKVSVTGDLRYIPEPIFHLDNSIEQGIYISKLIEKVKEDEEKRRE